MRTIRQLVGSSLFRESVIYTLSSFFLNSVPIILLGYLTRAYQTTDFGIIGLFTLLQAFLMPLVGMNMNIGLSRLFYKTEQHPGVLLKGVLFAIRYAMLSAIVLSLIVLLLGTNTEKMHLLSSKYLLLAIATTFSQFVVNMGLLNCQLRQQPLRYLFFSTILVVLNIAATFFFVSRHFFLNGRVMGIFVSTSVVAVLLVFLFLRETRGITASQQSFISIVKTGLPIIPHTFAGIVIGLADRYFLSKYFGLNEVGYFSAVYQFGGALMLFFSSINLAYVPWLYKKMSASEQWSSKRIMKSLMPAVALVLLVSIVFFFVARLAFEMMVASDYLPALKFLSWITLSAMISGLYMLVANIVFYTKYSKYISIVSLTGAVSYVALCPYLSGRFGATGVTMTSFIANCIILVLTACFAGVLLKTNKYKK